MDATATARIPCAFTQMPDPRRNNARHRLTDILTIALFAVICGADGWAAVAEYGRAKFAWLATFLELPHGIPSHDTFGDVFAKLQPHAFEHCFMQWMKKLVQLSGGKLVAIDGKSLRRSFETHGTKAAWPTWSAPLSRPTTWSSPRSKPRARERNCRPSSSC